MANTAVAGVIEDTFPATSKPRMIASNVARVLSRHFDCRAFASMSSKVNVGGQGGTPLHRTSRQKIPAFQLG